MLLNRGLRLTAIARAFSTGKNMHEINSMEEFKKKLETIKTPILVDFYANWCGPCKALMPRLTKKLETDAGKWTLLKVDIDKDSNSKICQQYQVSAVPTLVYIKDGKEVDKRLGNLSDQALNDLLK